MGLLQLLIKENVWKFAASMRTVVLLLLGIHLTFAGRYSLQYLNTVVSKVINIPEFTVVGLVNDQQFMYFDSNTKKAVPKTEWIKQNGEDYWNKQTESGLGDYQEYKNYMQIIMALYNQSISEGVHTLQVLYGCEVEDDDDDTTQGYYEFGYDGEDFISFDKNTLSWTAVNPQAGIIKNKWSHDKAKAEYWKRYLENECIGQLKKYLIYGKESLGRKDAPQVSLLQKDSSSPVICHATGFYPSNIMMTWWKNHEEIYEDVEVGFTLPNTDGSFQKSIISYDEDWKEDPCAFRCVVNHVGENRVVSPNGCTRPNSASDNGIAIIAVFFGCVPVIFFGCVMMTVFVAIKLRTVRRKTIHVKISRRARRSAGHLKGSTIEMDSTSDQSVRKASSLQDFTDF